MSNYKIILEQCYPGKGNKKGELKILTDKLSGQKVGDIEYHGDLGFEDSGDYRVVKIISLAAERRRLKKEKAIKEAQVQAQEKEEKERLGKFKAEFDDDLEFAVESYTKNLSLEEAKIEYWRRWDERVQKAKAAVAEPIATEDPSSEVQGDFITAGRELAAAENIKLGEALKRVARKQPELHRAYKQRCQGQNRADYGREV